MNSPTISYRDTMSSVSTSHQLSRQVVSACLPCQQRKEPLLCQQKQTRLLPDAGLKGREGIRESITGFRAAFPDLHFTLEDQLAEGDQVVIRYIVRGTHLGPVMGIPATGTHGTLTGIDIYRISHGKIEEAWSNWDTLGMLRQMGVLPPTR